MRSVGPDAAGPYELEHIEHRGFRADMKRPFGATGGPLYLLTVGRATEPSTGNLFGGSGFLMMRSASGRASGPWEERLVYEFAANGHGSNGSAWDCDVKDPSFVIHANGTVVIASGGACRGGRPIPALTTPPPHLGRSPWDLLGPSRGPSAPPSAA